MEFKGASSFAMKPEGVEIVQEQFLVNKFQSKNPENLQENSNSFKIFKENVLQVWV